MRLKLIFFNITHRFWFKKFFVHYIHNYDADTDDLDCYDLNFS